MKSPEELACWLKLLAAPGIGLIRCNQLLKAVGGPRRIFGSDKRSLAEIEGISEKAASVLLSFSDSGFAEQQLGLCAKWGAAIVCQDDPGYPSTLRQLADAPPLLFVRGALKPEDARSVAIVGSRNASVYGKGIAASLGRDLARHGFCVVSGMARGIDTAGHSGALDQRPGPRDVRGPGAHQRGHQQGHQPADQAGRQAGANSGRYTRRIAGHGPAGARRS